MITGSDINKMKEVFATKADLKQFATKEDVVKSTQSVKKTLHKIDKKLDLAISFFDNVTTKHSKRLNRLEQHVGLPPYPDN